jgi:hypothetical protein
MGDGSSAVVGVSEEIAEGNEVSNMSSIATCNVVRFL